MYVGIISTILGTIGEVLKGKLKNEQERLEIMGQIETQLIDLKSQLVESARDVIVAETQSDSKLARSWRPLLMYVLMGLLVWIGVVAPLFDLQEEAINALERVPSGLWTLLTVGMGGYIGGRSLEKIIGKKKS